MSRPSEKSLHIPVEAVRGNEVEISISIFKIIFSSKLFVIFFFLRRMKQNYANDEVLE